MSGIVTIEDHLNGVVSGECKVYCPFHDDTHASAVMYPSHAFYCFGCGVSLNVVQLIARLRYDHFGPQSMSMAKRYIADGGLIRYEKNTKIKEYKEVNKEDYFQPSDLTYKALAALANITKQELRNLPHLRRQIQQDRGIHDVKNLPLGWAADNLPFELAKSLGLNIISADSILISTGVCYPAKEGDNRDASKRFRLSRHRLIISEIRDDKTIFYQGRATGNSVLKYLSPPRIPKPLLGWNSLKKRTDRVWLCEGPFDILPLIEAGEAAIAITGSDLKARYVEDFVKKANGREIIVAMDSDDIGRLKAPIIQNSLIKAGARARVFHPPPPYKDMGEWITREGVKAVIEESVWSQ